MRLKELLLGGAVGVLALAAAAPLQAETIEYVYDVHGRLILVRHVGTAQTAYVYDPADNRAQMVTALPGAPVPGNDFVSTTKNTAVTFDPRVNDADGDASPLTVTAVGTATPSGTVTRTTTSITYTPATNFTGDASFTYTVSDGTNTANATVNVRVVSPNQAPNAAPDYPKVAKNGSKSFDPRTNDSDPDGDSLSISAKTNGAHGTVSITGGGTGVTYTPVTDYVGGDTFSYTISDGTAVATTSVVVVVKTAPTATADAASTTRNKLIDYDPRTNDVDSTGGPLTVTAVGTPAHGTASVVSGLVRYNPTPGYSGSDSVSYTITDDAGSTANGTISMTVTANEPPTTVEDEWLTPKNQWRTFYPLTNDSDPNGDTLTVTGVTALHGTVATNGVYIQYIPTSGYTGPDTFTYTVSDGQGGTTNGTVNVTVY